MPFGPRRSPSLGLGLLKASLAESGIASSIQYLTLRFSREIGNENYDRIKESAPRKLAGEWVFAEGLATRRRREDDGYVEGLLGGETDAALRAAVVEARARAARFLERSAEEILSHRPRVVGFSSIFQQQAASLSLAKKLKQSEPSLAIVFGGANCEATMGAEMVKQFPFVDAVVSGEGDRIIVELLSRILNGAAVDDLTGVFTARNLRNGAATAPTVLEMDALPYPDFEDYFEQLGWELRDDTHLLCELSRGCWWGERHHCTFCGLNGSTMKFRSKSATRAADELEHLSKSYRNRSIFVVDNILDMKYFRDLIPEIRKRDLGLHLFFEVKANLRKEQIAMLKSIGVNRFQPGIESLSTAVLSLMNKGVTALQNVRLLKWCKELGVLPSWNMLWGFPGEDPEEYQKMADLMPLISHLPPPEYFARIRLDRFSPNFERATEMGFSNVRPVPAYQFIYDLPADALHNLAYYFSYDYADSRDAEAYTRDFRATIEDWRKYHAVSELLFIQESRRLVILDSRFDDSDEPIALEGLPAAIYSACDDIAPRRDLYRLGPPGQVDAILAGLVEAGLMLQEGNAFLALAISSATYTPELFGKTEA